MRNFIVLAVFIITFVLAVTQEPLSDSIDALAGATNQSYNVSADSVAGASYEEDDEDEEDDD